MTEHNWKVGQEVTVCARGEVRRPSRIVKVKKVLKRYILLEDFSKYDRVTGMFYGVPLSTYYVSPTVAGDREAIKQRVAASIKAAQEGGKARLVLEVIVTHTGPKVLAVRIVSGGDKCPHEDAIWVDVCSVESSIGFADAKLALCTGEYDPVVDALFQKVVW